MLATVVRAEADRDLTFKPANSNQKLTDKLAGPRERDFVQEMEKRNMSSQLKLQARPLVTTPTAGGAAGAPASYHPYRWRSGAGRGHVA